MCHNAGRNPATETTNMNATTKSTIEMAKMLGRRGFAVRSVEVQTPDGRCWSIDTIPAGRGRHADGHWGPKAGAPGGFRLFEIDCDRDDAPTEHDPVDYDTWDAGDLIDYLNAVGQPKARPITTRTTDPTT